MGKRNRSQGRLRQRRSAGKTRKKVIWIVGEGSTEKRYFEALHRYLRIPGSLAEIKVYDGKGGDAARVWLKAQKELKDRNLVPGPKGDVDAVWLVFDCEPHDPTKYNNAKDTFHRIQKEVGFEVCVSLPCMELWFLLHFCDCPPARTLGTAKATVKILQAKWPNYKKGDIDINRLNSKQAEARGRAMQLWPEEFPRNPATSVFRLVDELEKLGS